MSSHAVSRAGFDLGLAGSRAVVTGGSGAIGAAICRMLVEQGVTVWSLDLGLPSERIPGVHAVTADVRSRESIANASVEIGRDGPVDILVNSHGLQIRASAMDCTDGALADILDVNVGGCWRTCQAFGAQMKERGGAIVNIASINGIVAAKTGAAYGVSKAALIHFTRILALELAPAVRVNAVAPTYIRTPLNEFADKQGEMYRRWIDGTPQARLGEPEEVASVILFLASDAASLMTGSIVLADGGYSCW